MNRNHLTLFPALLAAVFLPVAHAAPKSAGDSARELFRNIEASASAAASDADDLDALITLSPESLESRVSDLDGLKELVNTMGRDAAKLEGARSQLSGPEQQAFDLILPLLRADADNTSKAIASFNHDRPSQPWNPEEAGYAQTIQGNSARIAGILRNCLKLEKLQDEKSSIEGEVSTDRNN